MQRGVKIGVNNTVKPQHKEFLISYSLQFLKNNVGIICCKLCSLVFLTWFSLFFFLMRGLLFFFFTLQYCIGFAMYQYESPTGIHMFPILNPPSHLPPCTLPLGYSSAPASSFLYPASNLDWRFISYMILYMFQCHSPKSSHRLPLPQSPKDCSIHQCLFCCLVYRVIVTIFLNSIYMR